MSQGGSAPSWVQDINLMQTFYWTEKQLYEEVSVGMVEKIKLYFNYMDKWDKMKEKMPKMPG